MDNFKKALNHKVGPGGLKCYCCNNKTRKGHGKVDKAASGQARARIKAAQLKENI